MPRQGRCLLQHLRTISTKPYLTHLGFRSADAKAGALLVTALDEVAWVLNLRGGDISYNPVFVSYFMLTEDSATLYIDDAKVGQCTEIHRFWGFLISWVKVQNCLSLTYFLSLPASLQEVGREGVILYNATCALLHATL